MLLLLELDVPKREPRNGMVGIDLRTALPVDIAGALWSVVRAVWLLRV